MMGTRQRASGAAEPLPLCSLGNPAARNGMGITVFCGAGIG